MFTSGTYEDLHVRMHQSQSGADITAYWNEALRYVYGSGSTDASVISGLFYSGAGSGTPYDFWLSGFISGGSGIISYSEAWVWERELQHKFREISGNGYTGTFLPLDDFVY